MDKKATIYRMVTPDHLCPWGIKGLDLLKRHGFEVEDHHLSSEAENEAYKKEHEYDETPQVFVNGEHLGGYDDLRNHLGLGPDPKEGETYQPVMAVFAVTSLMAIATLLSVENGFFVVRFVELFIAFSMCVLGMLKLQDLLSFATGFVQYDLFAQRYVPYSYVYPFVEAGAGVCMIMGIAVWVVAPITLLVSTIGAISVFKAVYVEKRSLSCACVGGGSSVPLGFISLTENLMMMAMAIWMVIKHL
ncbi:glutaredoxin family protein [Rubritalea spongiae]|uniref:Glutaredoxin family protein n=1 Tax=Rubritalea spongiae TaxID=430797 RepID=A0ABW5E4I8_9BACT